MEGRWFPRSPGQYPGETSADTTHVGVIEYIHKGTIYSGGSFDVDDAVLWLATRGSRDRPELIGERRFSVLLASGAIFLACASVVRVILNYSVSAFLCNARLTYKSTRCRWVFQRRNVPTYIAVIELEYREQKIAGNTVNTSQDSGVAKMSPVCGGSGQDAAHRNYGGATRASITRSRRPTTYAAPPRGNYRIAAKLPTTDQPLLYLGLSIHSLGAPASSSPCLPSNTTRVYRATESAEDDIRNMPCSVLPRLARQLAREPTPGARDLGAGHCHVHVFPRESPRCSRASQGTSSVTRRCTPVLNNEYHLRLSFAVSSGELSCHFGLVAHVTSKDVAYVIPANKGRRFKPTPPFIRADCALRGVTVRLPTWVPSCSPPAKANRVQYPVEPLPDFRMWGSSQTLPLVDGFSRGSPIPPPFQLGFQDLANDIRLRGRPVGEEHTGLDERQSVLLRGVVYKSLATRGELQQWRLFVGVASDDKERGEGLVVSTSRGCDRTRQENSGRLIATVEDRMPLCDPAPSLCFRLLFTNISKWNRWSRLHEEELSGKALVAVIRSGKQRREDWGRLPDGTWHTSERTLRATLDAHQVPHRHYARSTKLARKLFVEPSFLWDFKR
ncbi:hypothetical protein PR048_001461 [Dryococelus australis]|uniref:Uncharacterized protein n=1 Tax=Dryococelus australis TaxID=614101 RepID=A0ABQ9IHC8_9NEOP|nr:hypothetical protein PR048_001461 [Dryococelus australis]